MPDPMEQLDAARNGRLWSDAFPLGVPGYEIYMVSVHGDGVLPEARNIVAKKAFTKQGCSMSTRTDWSSHVLPNAVVQEALGRVDTDT